MGVNVRVHIPDDAERAAWHVELRSCIGVEHLEIVDGQATAPMDDLAKAWPLFARVGLDSAAAYLKTSRQMYMSSQGRDLDGKRLRADACIAVDDACREKFLAWQALAESRGCDAGCFS